MLRTRIPALWLACLVLSCLAGPLHAQTGPVTSNDIESPPNTYRGFRSGAELRTEYQNLNDGGYRYIVTPRLHYAVTPDISLRLETPYVEYSPGDDGQRSSGLGDVLMRAGWRAIRNDGFALVVAADLITDTKNDVRLGSGRSVIAPNAYAALDVPQYNSVFFPSVQHYALLYRSEDARRVSYTVLRPGLLTHWPNQVYTFLDPRFVVDWERNAKVGLTVELELGRHLNHDLAVWLRPGVGVINRSELPSIYEWNFELGLSHLF